MLHNLLILICTCIFISQGYLFLLAVFNIKAYLILYGLSETFVSGFLKGNDFFLQILPLSHAFFSFILSLFSLIWMVLKKGEGRVLFFSLGIVLLIEGLISYNMAKGVQRVFYIEGIRGAVIVGFSLLYLFFGRRKKYLFDVKK